MSGYRAQEWMDPEAADGSMGSLIKPDRLNLLLCQSAADLLLEAFAKRRSFAMQCMNNGRRKKAKKAAEEEEEAGTAA